MLTLAPGFKVPEEDRSRYRILNVSVGTDPFLATKTRRGTGYYKVPSLKGVWYRGPFEHNGSVATLADWFDSRRHGMTIFLPGTGGMPCRPAPSRDTSSG